jgi:hypothetical protein
MLAAACYNHRHKTVKVAEAHLLHIRRMGEAERLGCARVGEGTDEISQAPGRLLTNDTLLYLLFESPQTRAEIEEADISSTTAAKPATTWFHCSIGQAITPDDPED